MMRNFVFWSLLVAVSVWTAREVRSQASVSCDAECSALLRPSGSDAAFSRANCSFHSDTPTCHNLSLKYSFNRPCTTAELDVLFSSWLWHQPLTNIESHVRLNVTMVVYERVLAAFLELECVHAPDLADAYCHDHQRPNWDRMIWPCRSFDLHDLIGNNDENELRLPIRFAFDCFRIYGLSQYAFNVSLVPQMCRSTFVVTIPSEYNVHPEMAKHPTDKEEVNWSSWSPLLILDTNPSDGIWVRFAPPPPELYVKTVKVHLYRQMSAGESFASVYEKSVALPDTGVKIENVESGDYNLFLYIDRHDCSLHCNPSTRCRICPHTSINFTLAENHYTTQWHTWYVFVSVVKFVGLAAIGILLIMTGVIVGMIFYLRHRKNVVARTVQEVELTWRPKILLIYSDDCAAHSAVVAELGRFLQAEANAHIFLDQWALDNCTSSPDQWMLRSLENCDFYLVVLSAGTRKVFEGHPLIARRHFPDLFHVGVMGVMRELLRECRLRPPHATDVLRKYIWVRFDYSPADCVEPFLARLPCTQLVLPPDLLALIGHLHSVSAHSVDPSHRPDTGELDAAITTMREMITADPDWLDGRISSTVDEIGRNRLTEIEESISALPERSRAVGAVPVADAFRTANEAHAAAAANGRYALLEPDDDQADLLAAEPQYGLVGGPDQLSDSD